MEAVMKALDCLQACANHPSQAALATPGLLPSLRGFVKEGGDALVRRHKVFKAELPAESGWKIGSQGAHYAFVKHPFKGRSAMEVCEKLAKEEGVITLPAEFFTAGHDDAGPVEMEEGWDRSVRVSVANVEEKQIKEVCARLIEVKDTWGWEVDV
jgi:aspartate/methionine/tyrosine aminotransferase